ncbi:hypothetical protein AU252_07860 [Pseudarthrobacter sulfonivorans]|uniref:Uncharacterized protein n=1 Tax=Pseudarthrobacter sulfonivorans TaxID=121292 RepID=A0A0U3QNB2_9MICC|nr:DUF6286 domain-containing protein [Pseudarthrobacter sulfonivorans]ALV41077.1 hypothetical protein AU252_07860 [Pseudarthrobacter sulfonivorans]
MDGDLDSRPTSRARAQPQPDLRRVVYRETHSSRAAVAIVAAVLVMGLAGYGLLESAVHAIGQPAWLIEPQLAAERIVALPAGIPPLLLGASGAVVAMVGMFFLLNAILPGKRARHVLNGIGTSSAVVVDDEVIASALARSARLAANVTPEQVMVVVSRRQAIVNVRPTSGVPVAEAAVLAAVQDELSGMSLVPVPDVRVNISTVGVIGA